MTEMAASAGEFLIIGRRDDTGEIVVSTVDDIPKRTRVSDLCRRVLREMGHKDPLVYEFLVLIYAPIRGGARVILDQNKLRKYVYARWGRPQ